MTTFSAVLEEDGTIQIPLEFLCELGWQAGHDIAIDRIDHGWAVRRVDVVDE